MLKVHDIPGTHYAQVHLPVVATGDASAIIGTWVAPHKCKIVSIEHVPSAAITGVNTNTRHLNVQLAAGTEIANLDYVDGEDGAAATPNALTLTGTAAQLTLAAGAGLLIQSEKVGTGLALPIGQLRIGYQGA